MTNAIIPISAASSMALASGTLPVAPAPRPLGSASVEAQFSFNEELAQIVITLHDTDSGQVVRQIPPEHILRFAEFLLRTTGAILDARA